MENIVVRAAARKLPCCSTLAHITLRCQHPCATASFFTENVSRALRASLLLSPAWLCVDYLVFWIHYGREDHLPRLPCGALRDTSSFLKHAKLARIKHGTAIRRAITSRAVP